MKAFAKMLKVELALSIRGMDMFIFAICMPVAALIILGAIFGSKPAFDGAEYTFLEQSFGALSTIAICAGGVMGLPLVVSDYRGKKILKRFKVTPVSPALILLVQVTIYALYSLVSLALLLAVGRLFFGLVIRGHFAVFFAGWLFVMISMFSIGLMVGGIAKDSKTAGMIASLLYFPMLIFSGATLPYEVMPAAMQKIADIMPLTQGIKLLKAACLGLPMQSAAISVAITAAVAAVCTFVALRFFRWE